MEIRAALDTDAPAVLSLWEDGGLAQNRPSQSARLAGHRRADGTLVLVAVEGDDVIGTVTGAFDGVRGWVYRLAVRDDCRRRGVATALAEEVERRLEAKGATAICLLVHGANRGGMAFWETVGYDLVPDVVYVKKTLKGG